MTSLSDVTNSTATHADVSMVTSRWRKSGETRRCCGRTSAGELTWRTTTSLLQRLTAGVGRYANRSLLSVCASLWTVSRQAAVSCSGHGCSAADSKTAAPRATCIATCRTLWLMDIPPHHMCIAVGIIIVTITSHHRQPHLTSPVITHSRPGCSTWCCCWYTYVISSTSFLPSFLPDYAATQKLSFSYDTKRHRNRRGGSVDCDSRIVRLRFSL